MPQVFHRSTTSMSRFTIFGALFMALGLGWLGDMMQRSAYVNYMGVAQIQPVPFSHEHHVGGLGIDCRYCHTSVEPSNFAGIPPTKTCMNCHSQIWANAPMLEPVRASFRTGNSLVWTRVNDLPDFVYFDHSIHINKGVGCNSCHGPVDKMPLMYQAESLQMEWCLNCHRAPDKFLRPKDQVFNMRYEQPSGEKAMDFNGKHYTDQRDLGKDLIKLYGVHSPNDITSCSTCHR